MSETQGVLARSPEPEAGLCKARKRTADGGGEVRATDYKVNNNKI